MTKTVHNTSGLYKLSRPERIDLVAKHCALNKEEQEMLLYSAPDICLEAADVMIENTIGCFALPLGIATNCIINNKSYLIPLAVEETSIIAALSSTAKWLNQRQGTISATVEGKGVVGQLFFSQLKDAVKVKPYVLDNKAALIETLNAAVVTSMVRRGGGIIDLFVKDLHELPGVVVHVVLDSCDAMGANLVSQVCEKLRDLLQERLAVLGLLAIVSNLSDCKLSKSSLTIAVKDEVFAEKIVEASKIAAADMYRAVTHNKGSLNSISALAITTGNDWRAIEASLHGYAAKGRYKPLATWTYKNGCLQGSFVGPIPVGHVGGASCHPMVRVCKKILGTSCANELAAVMAAVGLLQNLAALRALVGKGIVQGHMRLHIDNLILSSQANNKEAEFLRRMLAERLVLLGKVTMSDVLELLGRLRGSDFVERSGYDI